jgi:hypothetical protein
MLKLKTGNVRDKGGEFTTRPKVRLEAFRSHSFLTDQAG